MKHLSFPLPALLRRASRVSSLPVVRRVAPAASPEPSAAELSGHLKAQRLAFEAVRHVGSLLRPGWTERDAARLINVWLGDHGVECFFHRAFVWFGDRTRYVDVRRYKDYLPTERVLQVGDPYILDVAPVFDGYCADVGYSNSYGECPALRPALEELGALRLLIPQLFSRDGVRGGDVWRTIDERIRADGFDSIHALYPFSVLGHRVHKIAALGRGPSLLNFGWQSYWEFLARGLFGQLLNELHEGTLDGLWAIEPHLGGNGFGAKFEEILVVDKLGARWLDPDPLWVYTSS